MNQVYLRPQPQPFNLPVHLFVFLDAASPLSSVLFLHSSNSYFCLMPGHVLVHLCLFHIPVHDQALYFDSSAIVQCLLLIV